MNEPRNRIFNSSNSRHVCSVVVAAFGIQTVTVPFAFADVAMPPPAQHQNASFPSEQALRNMGYNPDTGVWRVNAQNTGRAEVKSDGATITGSQPKTVTATGVHGEKAQIATVQRQNVSISKLQTASNAVAVGVGFSNAANSAAPFTRQMGESIAKGNYGNAAWNAVQALANAADGFFSSPVKSVTNLFESTANGYLDGKDEINLENQDRKINAAAAKVAASRAKAAQAQAERAGDFRAAVANAAAAKAATAAASAEQQQFKNNQEQRKNEEEAKKQGMKKYQLIVEVDGKYQNYVFYSKYDVNASGSQNTETGRWGVFKTAIEINIPASIPSKITVKTPSDRLVFVRYNSYKSEELPANLKGKIPQNQVDVKPEDFMLNQQEVAGILNKMLKDQNTNHAELMNQLAKLGGVIDKATTANSFAPATALSAPFTPEGSNVPQQTLFKLDDKGNVTATAIPRPDLKPNSSQAPARQSVAPAPTVGHNNVTPAPSGQTGEQTAPSGQQNRPETEAGGNPPENYDYEDFIIPERTVDLGTLRPVNVFATDGVCPSGVSVQMGVLGTIDFNYDEACRILRLLRPIIILATMITCSMMAYAAVKEL
ncbi:virulence factor TspB C-terminal domain-related protein [Neisseria cinerea]|uniref:virulence factor TspB C-terminal domain-related protein n=1 Tax=Neisseria cinerea TaxID=483 RepID=UPI000D390751|nr:virulence factor TspB C-terminal domain-related protein [Neisseria cinerea]